MFLPIASRDNLNGMEKPPFQFGLKAAFTATIGAAVLASLAVPPEAAGSGAALAVIAAIAFVGVLSLAVVVAFALSVSMTPLTAS